ncbi:hypothetical protein [Rhodococcus jostii]|uniref:hypothetical protein n=1 Tax=Rhodococcus jostii TaxID=132919 RepID=UPI00362E98DC
MTTVSPTGTVIDPDHLSGTRTSHMPVCRLIHRQGILDGNGALCGPPIAGVSVHVPAGLVMVAVHGVEVDAVCEWRERFDGVEHQPAQDAGLLGDRLLGQPQVLPTLGYDAFQAVPGKADLDTGDAVAFEVTELFDSFLDAVEVAFDDLLGAAVPAALADLLITGLEYEPVGTIRLLRKDRRGAHTGDKGFHVEGTAPALVGT